MENDRPHRPGVTDGDLHDPPNSEVADWRRLAIDAATAAANFLADFFDKEFDRVHAQTKPDGSPVTNADSGANDIIAEILAPSGIPILSEEAEIPFQQRKDLKKMWIVDPLDGTKEFLRHSRAFAVNIALLVERRLTVGVIAVPMEKQVFSAAIGLGAACNGQTISAHGPRSFIALSSRSHGNPREAEYLAKTDIRSVQQLGSAVKFCRMAQGQADLYPKFGPCSEWDVAAGELITREAGCQFQAVGKASQSYNKETPTMDGFIVAHPDFALPL